MWENLVIGKKLDLTFFLSLLSLAVIVVVQERYICEASLSGNDLEGMNLLLWSVFTSAPSV